MSERARPPTDFPIVLQRVGGFSYFAGDDRWEWSDAVARLHGYEPGSVTPTTELILSHKHEEDRLAVAEIIEQVVRGEAPFSSRHRIIDTGGHTHHVVVVGEHLFDEQDRVIGSVRPGSTSTSPRCSRRRCSRRSPTPWPASRRSGR